MMQHACDQQANEITAYLAEAVNRDNLWIFHYKTALQEVNDAQPGDEMQPMLPTHISHLEFSSLLRSQDLLAACGVYVRV